MAVQLQHLRSSLPSLSISQLPPSLRSKPALVTLGAISVLGLARTMRALARDYASWKAMGPGGVAHDVRGYLVNVLLTPLTKRDTTSVGMYARPQKMSLLESTSYIGTSSGRDPATLPERPGPRPTIAPHTAPSRQLDMKPPRHLTDQMVEQMRGLVAKDPTHITFGESFLERGGPALFLQKDQLERAVNHRSARANPGEIAHCHLSDGSCHVFLSAKDASIVLSAGWGERHPLSGRPLLGYGLPSGFIMVYAPRDEKEVGTVMEILKAAVRYAAEGRADV